MKCCVRGCTNVARDKKRGVSFHLFPNIEEKKQEWLHKLNMPDVNRKDVICSEHFRAEYIFKLPTKSVLKNGAIPELKIPTSPLQNNIQASRPLSISSATPIKESVDLTESTESECYGDVSFEEILVETLDVPTVTESMCQSTAQDDIRIDEPESVTTTETILDLTESRSFQKSREMPCKEILVEDAAAETADTESMCQSTTHMDCTNVSPQSCLPQPTVEPLRLFALEIKRIPCIDCLKKDLEMSILEKRIQKLKDKLAVKVKIIRTLRQKISRRSKKDAMNAKLVAEALENEILICSDEQNITGANKKKRWKNKSKIQ